MIEAFCIGAMIGVLLAAIVVATIEALDVSVTYISDERALELGLTERQLRCAGFVRGAADYWWRV